jgi:hypothetical protein
MNQDLALVQLTLNQFATTSGCGKRRDERPGLTESPPIFRQGGLDGECRENNKPRHRCEVFQLRRPGKRENGGCTPSWLPFSPT